MPALRSTTALTSSAALFASLLDKSPHGIIAYEPVRDKAGTIIDYRTIYYNPQVLSITGHNEDELTNQLLFQRAPYARMQEEQLRQVVENQIPYDVQHLIPTTNRWFAFENRPLGNGYFTTLRDIDDLKRTEQQLEKQNIALQRNIEHTARQQTLLNSVLRLSPGAISVEKAIRDEGGRVIDFQVLLINSAALALSNHTEADVLHQSNSQLNPEFISSGLRDQYVAVVETGRPLTMEYFYAPANKLFDLSVTRMDAEHVIVLFTDVTQARLDAEAIRRNNEVLDGVLRTSDSSIIVYEAVHDEATTLQDFRIVLINDAGLQVTNSIRQEVVGMALTTLYPDTKRLGLWHQYVTVYETGEPFRGRHYYPGVDKWFDVTIRKLGDGLVSTLNDITQIYSATRQIEEQARLFEGVLDNITNGLSVLEAVRDEAGELIDVRYVQVSKTVLADTGLTQDQLIGQSMMTLYPGIAQTPYWAAYQAVFSTGEPQHFETHYHYDGFDNYTANWVTRLDENRIISIYSVINDQKKAESIAKQHAAILQNVLNGCQTPIVLFEAIRNAGGQIVDFRYLIQNDANARLVGLPIAETTAKTMLAVLPELKSSGLFDRYVAVVETGQPQHFEQQFTGGVVDGWFTISLVKQDDGIVVAVNDQTLLHNTLQHAEQLVVDLQHSNQNLEHFASIASHDLQEPLRKIQSFGNLLIEQHGNDLPDEGQMMLRRMQSAAGRMSQLIRDLLAYSRLSSEQEPFRPVSLQQIIAEIRSDLELVINEKKARVILHDGFAQTLPTLNGNPVQLRQLFQNLVSNALKFSRPGTSPHVSIEARFITPADVPTTVPNRKKRSWVAIDITDNGIGFDEKYQEQIFQLFERLHGRNDYSGTGIGLAVCRKVAENHGGTITAQSQPGAGATFTVFLPM